MTTLLKISDGTELLNADHITSFKIGHRPAHLSDDVEREHSIGYRIGDSVSTATLLHALRGGSHGSARRLRQCDHQSHRNRGNHRPQVIEKPIRHGNGHRPELTWPVRAAGINMTSVPATRALARTMSRPMSLRMNSNVVRRTVTPMDIAKPSVPGSRNQLDCPTAPKDDRASTSTSGKTGRSGMRKRSAGPVAVAQFGAAGRRPRFLPLRQPGTASSIAAVLAALSWTRRCLPCSLPHKTNVAAKKSSAGNVNWRLVLAS